MDGDVWDPHGPVSPRDKATKSDGTKKEPSRGGTSKTSRSQRQSGTQKAFLSTAHHINVKWVDILINCLSVIRERPCLWVRVGGAFEYGTLCLCVLLLQY